MIKPYLYRTEELYAYDDERGALFEILRNDFEGLFGVDKEKDSDYPGGPIQQVYATTILPGIVKAWHLHKKQWDRMICVKGIIRFGFMEFMNEDDLEGLEEEGRINRDDGLNYEPKVESLVVRAERPTLVIIPPETYHGFQNLGNEEAIIINAPDRLYNSKQPDEFRKLIEPNEFWYDNRDR